MLTATNTYDLQSGTVSFSGVGNLAGSVGATKTTNGTVTLASANSFTGAVNVNGGFLSFSNINQLGNASATNTLGFNGGTLTYTSAAALPLGANRVVTINSGGGTFNITSATAVVTATAGFATSTGSLTKTGPGQLIIPGTVNLGTGGVTVSDGFLQAGFGTNGASAINVGATGSLSMQNSLIEALTLGNSNGALTLANGAELGFEFNGATNDSITLGATGTAISTGTITLDLFNLGAGITGGNTYTLLSSTSGGLTSGGATYLVGTAPTGFNYSVTATDNLVQLNVVNFSPAYWTNSEGSGSWSTLNGAGPFTSNFSTDAAGSINLGALPGTNETVIFSATNATGPAITTTLDGNFIIYSLQFAATPTGVTAVNINPGSPVGTLTIQPSTSAGGINVASNAGNVTVSAAVIASGVKAPAQTWNIDGTGVNGSSLTISGNVTFGTEVVETGAGTLTLSGASNTGAGGFTLTGGTANLNSNGVLGTGVFTINPGTTINNTGAGAVTLTNSSHIWNGNFIYTGGTQNLNLGTGPVSLGNSLTVTVSANTLTVGGVIGDGGTVRSVTKAGAGTLTLSAGRIPSPAAPPSPSAR